jgi:uncharacterized iron-regulated protein
MKSILATGWVLLATALAGLGGGCAGPGHARPGLPLREPHALPLFRGDGTGADFDALVSAAAQAQVVLIGEVHSHPQGLDFAAALWDGILARTDHAALSMEFFERDQQAGLDDYLSGVTDEAAFKKATGRTEGSYPSGHRRMVEAAKSATRPVLGANAPRRYVRIARLEGYDRLKPLTPEQQRLFDLPAEMPSEAYHERFVKLMSGMASDPAHGSPPPSGKPGEKPGGPPAPDPAEEQKTIESIYRSQVLWDATMSASIDRALEQGLVPVFHVVGGFHVNDDGGTLQLLRKRRPDAAIVTVAVVDADATSLRPDDKGKADYIVYVGPSPDHGGK